MVNNIYNGFKNKSINLSVKDLEYDYDLLNTTYIFGDRCDH